MCPADPNLAELPETYQKCFEDSTDAIVITDKDGRILRANPAWLRLYGYRHDEVVGQSTRIIKSVHTDQAMYGHMWQQIANDTLGFWKGEIVNRTKDGKEVPVLLTITPIRHDSSIVGYMGIGIDMTERKQFEEFRNLYEMVVRHDLKAPLNSVLSLTTALVEGYAGEVAPEQKSFLERIIKQTERMKAMIATAMDLEKLKRAKLVMDPEETDIVALLRSSIETLLPIAKQRGTGFSLLYAGAPMPSHQQVRRLLDPVHLQRCTENLAKNATEAAPSGTTVSINVEENQGGVEIQIHNQGAPIPPDVRATLFHPYSTYGKRGGTGLGIYGVKLTIEAMGGSIAYESDDRGTTFKLLLP